MFLNLTVPIIFLPRFLYGFETHPTWFSCRQVLRDVLGRVPDVVLPGDVHVDQAEEGAALHAQALGA